MTCNIDGEEREFCPHLTAVQLRAWNLFVEDTREDPHAPASWWCMTPETREEYLQKVR